MTTAILEENRLKEALLREESVGEELLAKRKQIIASRSREEQMEMMNQATDRYCRKLNEEYVRQQTELFKQQTATKHT